MGHIHDVLEHGGMVLVHGILEFCGEILFHDDHANLDVIQIHESQAHALHQRMLNPQMNRLAPPTKPTKINDT